MCESDKNSNQENEAKNDRLNNLLKSLSKFKNDFVNEKENCKKIREINAKLEIEVKEARESEKSHRYHLLSSREMIGNLQETVSQLVHLKRDLKKMKEEISSRESTIATLENDKETINQRFNENMLELRKNHERHIEEMTIFNEKKIEQVRHESDTQVAQFTCDIEELRSKIKDMEIEYRDKMNVVVLEYEEKIQRGASQVAQLQEQLARQAIHTDSNIDAYKRRLEELEEKLKQGQFKQYLAQTSYGSHYESQVERPYSAQRNYQDSVDLNPVLENVTPAVTLTPKMPQKFKPNTLQVMYCGDKTQTPKAADKKGPFIITKKRKLYNEKDYQDF